MRALTLSEALRYGHGIERPFLCPEHGDSRPSASVNTIKKVWICYTCGAHGRLGGEAILAEPDYQTMKLWVDNKLAEGQIYPESWLAQYDAGPVHQYWVDRVGEEAAREFRLGADSLTATYTYPLRDPQSRVLGVVRRSRGDEGPKYKYPQGVDVGRLLFNYAPEHRPVVTLTEGALDAIALWNVGVHAFAIYGSRLSAEQVRLIDRVDPEQIYTCYDMDDAGWRAHIMTEKAFKHRLVSRLSWPRAWGKDIDEIGETRRRTVVDVLASEPRGV